MSLTLFVMLFAAQPGISVPAPARPKLVCRESRRSTGSHIRSASDCKTAEQWQVEDGRLRQIPVSLTVTAEQHDGHPPPPRPQL